MARVLITGGAGFIGSHLCERFLAEGDDVICMDSLLTGSADNVAHLFSERRFTFIQQDVTNYIYVKGPLDAILHFASPRAPSTTWSCRSRPSRSAPSGRTRRSASRRRRARAFSSPARRSATATRSSIRRTRTIGAT